MNLLEFYKQVLENIYLRADNEGYIYPKQPDSPMITADGGKALVLPTKEQINSIYTVNEEGEPIVTKCLFNPLNEDIIKGDSIAIQRMKRIIETRLSWNIFRIADTFFSIYNNKDLQKNTTNIINQFLSGLTNLGISSGVKKIIDENTFNHWQRIYANITKSKTRLVSIFLKKKGKVENTTYNRLASLHSKLYEELCTWEKDTTIFDTPLRPKDVKIFKFVFDYIIPDLDSEHKTLAIGSNDKESPTFIALMSLYVTVMTRINKIAKAIKDIDRETYDDVYVSDLINIETLHNLDEYRKELVGIPSDIDINRSIVSPTQTQQVQIEQPNLNEDKVVEQERSNNMVKQPYPSQAVMINQPAAGNDDDVSKLHKALGGMSYSNQAPIPLGLPQPMVQQPTITELQVPPTAALTAPNTIVEQQQRRVYQQPVYRQPVMQQPVYQQPMMQQVVPQQQVVYPQQQVYQQQMVPQQQVVYQQQPMMQQMVPQQQVVYPQQQVVYQQQPQQMMGQPMVPNSGAGTFVGPQAGRPNISNPSGYWRS